MGQLSKMQIQVWSNKSPAYNTFIGGAGEDYPTAMLLATAMSIPPEAIQRFTVDTQFNILCRIDRDYTINSNAFSNYLGAGKKLKNYYIDEDGRVTGSEQRALANQPNLKLKFPNLLNWATQFNRSGNPNLVFIPECTIGGDFTFDSWNNGANRVYAPKLTTLGTDFLRIYNSNSNPVKKHVFYLNASIATNSGLISAISRGLIARYVTNYDAPNKVTNLSVSNIDVYDVKLNFTTPIAGTNPIDFYEVWFEKAESYRPEREFLPSDAEVTASGQLVRILEPETKYIMHICTVDTMYNGSGMFKDILKRAISNPVEFTTLSRATINITSAISAYWKLYTNSLDSSVNGLNGVDTSMTYSGGYAKFGTGYVDVADNNLFSFTDGINDTSAHFALGFIWNDKIGNQFFVNKRGASSNYEWQLFSNGTTLFFYFFNATSTSNAILITIPTGAFTVGVLNNLQFSYNGSKLHTGLKAYLNAAPVGTSSMTGTYTGQVNGTSQVRIGALASSASNYFKGDMKDLAIWKNRTMTPSEITEIDYRIKNNIPLI